MTSSFLIFILVGKVLTFFGNKFAESNQLTGFIGRLLTCQLCSGFWAYSLLSLLLGEYLFLDFFYVPVLSEVATGGIVSLLVHFIVLGWKSQFEVITIE